MRPSLGYALFCVAVLALFTFGQARGLSAFGWIGSGGASSSRSSGGGGFVSRGSGGFSGSHK